MTQNVSLDWFGSIEDFVAEIGVRKFAAIDTDQDTYIQESELDSVPSNVSQSDVQAIEELRQERGNVIGRLDWADRTSEGWAGKSYAQQHPNVDSGMTQETEPTPKDAGKEPNVMQPPEGDQYPDEPTHDPTPEQTDNTQNMTTDQLTPTELYSAIQSGQDVPMSYDFNDNDRIDVGDVQAYAVGTGEAEGRDWPSVAGTNTRRIAPFTVLGLVALAWGVLS